MKPPISGLDYRNVMNKSAKKKRKKYVVFHRGIRPSMASMVCRIFQHLQVHEVHWFWTQLLSILRAVLVWDLAAGSLLKTGINWRNIWHWLIMIFPLVITIFYHFTYLHLGWIWGWTKMDIFSVSPKSFTKDDGIRPVKAVVFFGPSESSTVQSHHCKTRVELYQRNGSGHRRHQVSGWFSIDLCVVMTQGLGKRVTALPV